MTRILVTGGSGFIGTNLIEKLRRRHDVSSLDVCPPRKPDHSTLWIPGDIRDNAQTRETFERVQPEVVFHLAARTDLDGLTLGAYDANTDGVANVIDALSHLNKPAHTMFASSRLVFAIGHQPSHEFDYKPSTLYGESKILGEGIVKARASEVGTWTLVRPTSIWGPWFGTPYRDFFDMVAKRRYVHIPGRNPRKSFGYVGNSVFQLERLAFADRALVNERVFWLSDYPALELRRWSELVAHELGVRPPATIPWQALRTAAVAGDIAKRLGYRSPPLTSFRLRNLVTEMVYDTTALEHLVGELPFSLEQGVEATVAWVKRDASKG